MNPHLILSALLVVIAGCNAYVAHALWQLSKRMQKMALTPNPHP